MSYELIDSGHEEKFERFGEVTLIRPCPQAVWRKERPDLWKGAGAQFTREKRWTHFSKLPSSWVVEHGGIRFKTELTDFGHLGLFPEHADLWLQMQKMCQPSMKVLNLFAYSGGMTLAAAQKGAEVCHLDSAGGMVEWGRENAALNGLEKAKIRWIVDDAIKFMRREVRRGSFYEGIILDPPTFGRGSKGEVFKIEESLGELLELCKALLSPKRKFLILSCHTPGFTPLVLQQTMSQILGSENLFTGELMLRSKSFSIPSGCYVIKTY